jgi:RNA polymerase sigma-70 factor (ECF subfamily)
MPLNAIAARVNRLFDAWYAVLVRHAFRVTGRLEVAEDVVQEAFYLLYRELAEGRVIEHDRAWTFSVVRRQALRVAYRRLAREVHVASMERLGGAVEPEENRGELTSLFRVLSPREQDVLRLCLEDLKYREIGALLGISPNSVSTLHRRAIRKLRREMGVGHAAKKV